MLLLIPIDVWAMSSYTRLDQILRQKPKRNRDDLKKHDSEIDKGKSPEKISPVSKKTITTPFSQIVMASVASGGGGASGTPTVENEKIMSSEEINNTIDEVFDDNGGSSSGNYAAAAAKKKKDYPYLLFVQRGKERRLGIRKAHFSAFEDHIWKVRVALSAEENEKILIEWVSWTGGCGLVAATDAHSAAWIKNQAASFIYETESCRAWSRYVTQYFL